jgi:hypothetical protein
MEEECILEVELWEFFSYAHYLIKIQGEHYFVEVFTEPAKKFIPLVFYRGVS